MSRRELAAHARRLSQALGAPLQPSDLLEEALTHPSASSPARADNQRLEFLGDRVLNLVLAEALLARHPDEPEGRIAARYNALVRKETCAQIAAEIGLGEAMRLGRSEKLTGGRRKQAMLGDAMEALIAAVYLEHGLDAARAAILRLWGPRLEAAGDEPPTDAKSALQKWAQARGMEPPRYATISREGADHAPVFTVAARLADGREATASAPSKRAAQQAAAARLLDQLESDDA
ncbi:ribonuclease III [Oceanicella actignis]|uniref:ribonuclease III n=1 Tax=Oceanicella actignis TaxID=1189325 RepID=UPI0011E6FDF3|nr:ribonuclease III [Oceanicella actignis]TYO91614.1 ribonuclease-3 [Oceanicella actignis]